MMDNLGMARAAGHEYLIGLCKRLRRSRVSPSRVCSRGPVLYEVNRRGACLLLGDQAREDPSDRDLVHLGCPWPAAYALPQPGLDAWDAAAVVFRMALALAVEEGPQVLDGLAVQPGHHL